jgi:hypothetical protein
MEIAGEFFYFRKDEPIMSVTLNTRLPDHPSTRTGYRPVKEFTITPPTPEEKEVIEEDPLDLAQAIKSYRSKVLTGSRELTEKEKKEIDELIKAFLKEYPLNDEDSTGSKSNREALQKFIRDLYDKYDQPAGFYEYARGVIDAELAQAEPPVVPPFELRIPPEPEKKPLLKSFQKILPHQIALNPYTDLNAEQDYSYSE